MRHDSSITLRDRFQGCLLGLATGDAIGTTLEFADRGSFSPIKEMIGGGPFNLEVGQWTDDTSMALCLAHSLISNNGFDAGDQMNRYCNWWQWGYMSSTGECFDIGVTVSRALKRYLNSNEPYSGSIDATSAGNGSLMRLAPVPMFFYDNLEDTVRYAGESSRTTHATAECIDSCRYFSSLIYAAFKGLSKNKILNFNGCQPETKNVAEISKGRYKEKTASEIRGSGYVIESMEAALWSFYTTDSYESAVLKAANLGDDADTTAAIAGQVAGAYYGIEGIPQRWLGKLYQAKDIEDLADALCRF